jgi:DNA-binding beta-propeller fold protein YncE
MFQTVLLAGLAVVGTLIATTRAVFAQSSESALRIEAKIPLGDVRGRIDHMAFDLARQRLFVAELGNDSVGVVDLKDQRTIRTIAGLAQPQGVGYVASTDTLYAANARDGTVRLFRVPTMHRLVGSTWAATPTTSASMRQPIGSWSDMATARSP